MRNTKENASKSIIIRPLARDGITVPVIACGTILVALTSLIQALIFWLVYDHDVTEIIRTTPGRALCLEVVVILANLGLLVASIGLLWRKPWGLPVFIWTIVLWTLAVSWLIYLIVVFVNLPVYIVAILLLHNSIDSDANAIPVPHERLNVRRIVSVGCLTLSCALHLWALLAASDPGFWGWYVFPMAHPSHLFVPAVMLFIVGVVLAPKSRRLLSANIPLMVFCMAFGMILIASTVLNTSLHVYLPEAVVRGDMPYRVMCFHFALIAIVALLLNCFSSLGRSDASESAHVA